MQRLQDLSLGKKLLLYLVLFIIIPLITAAVLINSKATGALYNKTYENAIEVLKQTRFNIESMTKEIEYMSLSILSDESMQDFLRNYDHTSPLEIEIHKNRLYAAFNEPFQYLLDSRPYIDSISLNRHGRMLFQYGDMEEDGNEEFHEQAYSLKGIPFWTSVYPFKSRFKANQNKQVISFVRVINDLDTSKPLAVLKINVNESTLSKLYSDIHHWDEGTIFIVDASGNIISSSDKTQLGQSITDQKYYTQLNKQKSGYLKFSGESKDWVLFHYEVQTTDWKVVQIIPEKQLIGPVGIINLFIFAGIIICLIFGLIFSFIQHKSIVSPLKRLYIEMNKVRKGDFNVKLPITKQDEIGRVSFIFVDMIKQIQELIERVYKGQIREQESQLKALQAQINPHFLYNTLDSIRWTAVKNKDFAVSEQIEVLADLFRHVLNHGDTFTTIQQEVKHLEDYMFIQNIRHGSKIEFECTVDPELLEVAIPKLILQPLVENATQHGLEPKMGQGKIHVLITRKADEIQIVVEDDGVGMPENHICLGNMNTEGYGIRNIHERIQLTYGEGYGLNIKSEPHVGTKIVINLPWRGERSNETANRG
ncbi:sensor histidine kinase [Paenibacillus lemnae]|uniref:Sensor histidine kinase n=1 Tax=Paenibacillus lemnae TaxID=1330551 RepID=A0A848MBR7_PAELE|nr:sensor histidine kinase [Paenibacillus lemnae]